MLRTWSMLNRRPWFAPQAGLVGDPSSCGGPRKLSISWSGSVAIGSVTTTHVPLPAELSILIVPPSASTRSCKPTRPGLQKAPIYGAFAEPSDGLEPSTPSLPTSATSLARASNSSSDFASSIAQQKRSIVRDPLESRLHSFAVGNTAESMP
jgi:hypothetical protein